MLAPPRIDSIGHPQESRFFPASPKRPITPSRFAGHVTGKLLALPFSDTTITRLLVIARDQEGSATRRNPTEAFIHLFVCLFIYIYLSLFRLFLHYICYNVEWSQQLYQQESKDRERMCCICIWALCYIFFVLSSPSLFVIMWYMASWSSLLCLD